MGRVLTLGCCAIQAHRVDVPHLGNPKSRNDGPGVCTCTTAVFTFLAKEAFGTRTSASTLAAVRDDGKDVASVVHASNSEMSLAIMSDAMHEVCFVVILTTAGQYYNRRSV